jgi:hypothetical protein
MPTTIFLNGVRGPAGSLRGQSVNVEEEGDAVHEAWIAASGMPFVLKLEGVDEPVWINPSAVTHWRRRRDTPAE